MLAHAALTWCLVGLIWTIQLVHYPLFAGVGAGGFPAYAAKHSRRITSLVAPLMLLEVLTGALLLFSPPPVPPVWVWWAGTALLALIWASTAFVQVPLHARLGAGFDARAHAALVTSNWLRTLAWTLRGLLVAWALGAVLGAV